MPESSAIMVKWFRRSLAVVIPLLAMAGVTPAQSVPPAAATVWSVPSTVKVMRDTPPPRPLPREVSISAARNEWEAFQVVLTPDENLRKVRVKVMDFIQPSRGSILSKENTEVFQVGYVPILERSGGAAQPASWPDPLIPHTRPVDLAQSDGNQPFWIAVKVPATAAAGVYSGSVRILINDQVVDDLPVRLTVWPFSLPEQLSLGTLFGLSDKEVAAGHGETCGSEAHVRLMDRYMLFLTQRRLQPSGLPVPIASGDAGRYLRDLRLQKLYVPFNLTEVSRESSESVISQLTGKKDLWERVVFYLGEDPKPEEREMLKLGLDHVKDRFPGARFMLASPPVPDLSGRVDIWSPGLSEFDVKSARQSQEAGQQVWWKLDRATKPPLPNLLIDEEGISHRILGWMLSFYQVDGLYCPSVAHNSTPDTEGEDSDFRDVWKQPTAVGSNGAEFLIYPGTRSRGNENGFQVGGPVSSMRLELLRDGLEDYEYLRILTQMIEAVRKRLGSADELFGQQRRRELCGLAVQDLSRYVHDAAKLERIRTRVAQEIVPLADQSLPLLVRTIPADATATALSGPGFTFEGLTVPGAAVTIAGQPIVVDGRGGFHARVYPLVGINRITIEARKGAQTSSTTRTFTIVKDPDLARAEEMFKTLLPQKAVGAQTVAALHNLLDRFQQGTYTQADHETAARLLTQPAAPSQPGTPSVAASPLVTSAVRPTAPPVPVSKVTLPPGVKNPVYVSLAHLAGRHRDRNEGDLAAIVEKSLSQVDPAADPRHDPCRVEPVVFLDKWGYRLSNGLVEAIVWRQGARIAQLTAGRIPLFHQPDPDAVKDNAEPSEWHDVGGYEDIVYEGVFRARRKTLDSLQNWNLVVTRQSGAEVTLEARKLICGGKLKLRRRMTLKQGDTALYVSYDVGNLTASKVVFPWYIHIDPGVGFAREMGRGNPWNDRLIVAATEPLKNDWLDRQIQPGALTTQLLQLTAPFVSAYDSLAKAALVVIPPDDLSTLRVTFNARDGIYTFEHGKALEEEGGLEIPGGSSAHLQFKLIGLFGVSSREEILNRFGKK